MTQSAAHRSGGLERGLDEPVSFGAERFTLPRPVLLFLAALFVAILVVSVHFPTTGDDWAWGSHVGLDRLHNRFDGYNGRYLGNLAVVVLTRLSPVTPALVALVLCGLVLLVADVANQRDLAGVCLAAMLLIGMPLSQWRQTVPWISGFSNYVLAALCLMAFSSSMRRDLQGSAPATWPRAWGLFVLAVASQLFIENVTILLLIGSAAWMLLRAVRGGHRVSRRASAWMIGAAAGAILMFSNSAYREAAGGSRYQTLGPSDSAGAAGVKGVVLQGAHGVSQLAVVNNTLLNACLLILIAALAVNASFGRGRIPVGAAAAVSLAFVALASAAAISRTVPPGHLFGSATAWSWVPGAALALAIAVTARSLVRDPFRSWSVLALAVGVVVLVAPMAAVTPYGPRTFLASYVLMTAIALVLLAELRATTEGVLLGRITVCVAVTGLAVVLSGYWAVYRIVDHAEQHRASVLEQAVRGGRESVELKRLPFSDYIHHPEPGSGTSLQYFRTYYRVPGQLQITFARRR
jgi:hypothetical protein